MKSSRPILLEWAEQARLDGAKLSEALRLTDVIPTASHWRRFIDKLLLGLGALLVVSGVIFFFAYNWGELSRFSRFALVEGLIVITLLAVWHLGLDKLSGKATLMAAGVLVGALLALVGQTYQTGADTYELFAVWCVLILPWAALSRFDLMWLFSLLLLNVAIILYYKTFGGFFNTSLGVEQLLWLLFILNTAVLMLWECAVHTGRSTRRSVRWMTRLLASVSGGLITVLAVTAVFDNESWGLLPALLIWSCWMLMAYSWYRKTELDIFVLAVAGLSVVVVINVALGRFIFDILNIDDLGGLLLMSFSIIGLSATAALWLKRVVTEVQG